MYIWFDDNNKVTSVTEVYGDGPNYIYSPVPIALYKDSTVSLHVHKVVSSRAVYKNEKNKEVYNRVDKGRFNIPVMEKRSFSRSIGLLDAPGEWTVSEVVDCKYKTIAGFNGFESYWYDEFFSDSSVNFKESVINTSSKGISILPGKSLVLNEIALPKKIKKAYIYIEPNYDDGSVRVECETSSGKIVKGRLVTLDLTNSIVVKLTNITKQNLPVTAVAILY